LELDLGHYGRRCFLQGVLDRSDGTLDQLNRIWSDESMVPNRGRARRTRLWRSPASICLNHRDTHHCEGLIAVKTQISGEYLIAVKTYRR